MTAVPYRAGGIPPPPAYKIRETARDVSDVHDALRERFKDIFADPWPQALATRVMEAALTPVAMGEVMARRLRRICPALGEEQAAGAFLSWHPTLAVVGQHACHVFVRLPLNTYSTDGRMHPPKAPARASLGAWGPPTTSCTLRLLRPALGPDLSISANVGTAIVGAPPWLGRRGGAASCCGPRLGRRVSRVQDRTPRWGRRPWRRYHRGGRSCARAHLRQCGQCAVCEGESARPRAMSELGRLRLIVHIDAGRSSAYPTPSRVLSNLGAKFWTRHDRSGARNALGPPPPKPDTLRTPPAKLTLS